MTGRPTETTSGLRRARRVLASEDLVTPVRKLTVKDDDGTIVELLPGRDRVTVEHEWGPRPS